MKWQFKREKKISTKVLNSSKSPLWNQCEELEFNVFSDCNYINLSEHKRINTFDKYQISLLIAAIRAIDRRLTGVVRVVCNINSDMQKEYFPTIDHADIIERPADSLAERYLLKQMKNRDRNKLIIFRDRYEEVMSLAASRCMDFSTFAILPEYRDAKTSNALITRTIFLSWERSVRYALTALDTQIYTKFKQRGLPVKALGPSAYYWGSPTIATLSDLYAAPKNFWKLLIPIMQLKGKIGGRV
ncbi:MAG: hypothetical protein V6Z89_16625 [Desulfobacter sp.]